MKKLIIISHEPLTIHLKSIFYIDELTQYGMQVQYWDCSQYFHKGMIFPDEINTDSRLKHYNTLKKIHFALLEQELENTIFIVEVISNFFSLRFFKLLTDLNIKIISLVLYVSATLPNLPILKKVFLSTPIGILRGIRNKITFLLILIYKKANKVQNFYLRIGSGNYFKFDKKINHPDWEKSKEQLENFIEYPYAVFVDEYFPLHPDLKFYDKLNIPNPNEYYTTMNKYFDIFEKNTGLKIIIAAHPKSDYLPKTFNNRPIIKYKTNELIRFSQIVLLHVSTAISYAIIYNKKVIFLCTRQYRKKTSLYYFLEMRSRYLNIPITNIEKSFSTLGYKIDEKIQQQYIYDFLTSPETENLSNPEILFNIFSKL